MRPIKSECTYSSHKTYDLYVIKVENVGIIEIRKHDSGEIEYYLSNSNVTVLVDFSTHPQVVDLRSNLSIQRSMQSDT